MRIVHHSAKLSEPEGELEKARFFEQQGDLDRAEIAYKQYIKKYPGRELAYQRLMVIYRKQKEYKKELDVIRKGIKAFEDLYRSTTRLVPSKKIAQLSRALLKSTGLADKKGKQLYDREPIGSWRRRKTIVEKKLGA